MKKRILIIVGVVLVVIVVAAVVGSNPTEPANDATQLDLVVSNGISLQDVYDLMSPELQNQAMRIPALNIEETAEENWHFVPKEDADLGDTDAPYLVVAVPAEQQSDGFLMLFFQDKQLFDTAWFSYDGGWNIIDKLWTTQQK